MSNHAEAIVAVARATGANLAEAPCKQKKTAGPTPCRSKYPKSLGSLFLVDGFLQFRAGGKFRDLAGGDFNRGAGLRIASIARLPLRY
jgi:hypothetical protein